MLLRPTLLTLALAAGLTTLTSCDNKSGGGDANAKGYYFSVTSSDEWGNESELSNEIFVENAVSSAKSSSISNRSIVGPHARPATVNLNNAQPGVVNIKFKPEMRSRLKGLRAASSSQRTGVQSVDNAMSNLGSGVEIKRLFDYVERTEDKAIRHGLDLWYTITYDPSLVNVSRAVSLFSNQSEIDVVETIGEISVVGGSQTAIPITMDEMTSFTQTANTKIPFNDPLITSQWHYDGALDKDYIANGGHINALRAWKRSAGSNDVIVAVMDHAMNPEHEDLAGAMWVNSGETPGDGIDNDGNGYIDDIYGWNFIENSGTLTFSHDHGSHVGGTVAAVNNNGIGGAGVAGGTGSNDGARLMSLDVLSGTVTGASANAFRYAADNGAVIAQCSYGYNEPNYTQQSIEDAINYFIAEAGDPQLFPNSPMRGGIVFFATGNSGSAYGKYYPAAYSINIPNVISVTSTNAKGNRPDYANVGDWVSIAAPGGADGNTDRNGKMVASCLWGYAGGQKYGYMSGTSMACPHVSGVAALILSVNKGITSTELREMILNSGKSILTSAPNHAALMGAGCINSSKYVSIDDKTNPEKVKDFAFKFEKGSYIFEWTSPNDPSQDEVTKSKVYFSTSPITQENLSNATQFELDNTVLSGEKMKVDIKDIPGVDIAK